MSTEIILLICIFATVVFGEKVEKVAGEWIEDNYESHIDRDPFKTYFAIYGPAYWTAAITLLCIVTLVEKINLIGSPVELLAYVICYAIAIKFFGKWTSMIYRVAKNQDEKLQEYLSK